MTHRIEQVESLLKRTLSEVLTHKLHDPRLRGLISITGMKVSSDLREARVSISVLPEKYEALSLAALQHATRRIHQLVCKAVALRTVPHFHFVLDRSLKKQAEVFDAIREGLDRPPPVDTPEPDADQEATP